MKLDKHRKYVPWTELFTLFYYYSKFFYLYCVSFKYTSQMKSLGEFRTINDINDHDVNNKQNVRIKRYSEFFKDVTYLHCRFP